MKNLIFTLIFLIFGVILPTSCQKKDHAPELSDVIFIDLTTELDIAQKNLVSEEAQNKKTKAELDAVVPQTGQNKYAAKRYFESLNNLDLYRQQVQYFKIAVELRRSDVRYRYQESLLPGGRPMIDLKEIADYKIRLKLQKAKLSWGKKRASPEEPSQKEAVVPRGTVPVGHVSPPTTH